MPFRVLAGAIVALSLSLLPWPASAARWSPAEYAGTLSDADLDEVSGLATSRIHPGILWAENDSGNGAKLIALKTDGTQVATFRVEGAVNVDWEDIDSFILDGKPYLLLADTGDNGGIRKQLQLYVFAEPTELRDGAVMKPAWTIRFRWPDGARDCEATAVDAGKGEVLLISKKRVPPELFRLPLRPPDGEQTAELLGTLPGISQPSAEDLKANPIYGRYRSQVSGADLSPSGRVLAVLTYRAVYFYIRPDRGSAWSSALAKPSGSLRFPWLPQAEAIAFSPGGTELYIGSEQRPTPLLRYRVDH